MLKKNLEEIALGNIDWVQGYIDIAETNLINVKEEIEKLGYKIIFRKRKDGKILCTLLKSEGDTEILIKGIAKVADCDVYIEKLGKYLALSRVAEKVVEFEDIVNGNDD